MAHRVSLQLRHEVHCYYHQNQQRGAAEAERYSGIEHSYEFGQQTDSGDIKSAPKRQSRQHFVNVFSRMRTRSYARHKCTGPLQIVRRVSRVEDQRGIEEAEEYDHHRV